MPIRHLVVKLPKTSSGRVIAAAKHISPTISARNSGGHCLARTYRKSDIYRPRLPLQSYLDGDAVSPQPTFPSVQIEKKTFSSFQPITSLSAVGVTLWVLGDVSSTPEQVSVFVAPKSHPCSGYSLASDIWKFKNLAILKFSHKSSGV
jgi:hypothetical protein